MDLARAVIDDMSSPLTWKSLLGQPVTLMACAGAVLLVARIRIGSAREGGLINWSYFAKAWLLVTLAVWIGSLWFSPALTIAEAAYLGTMSVGLGTIFRTLRRALAPNDKSWQEYVRILSILFGAGWLFSPFFTSRMLGGLDARWYGYVMADALQQARAGIFPVFVGQGEFMYNGAVHPYRTAPYFANFGIVIDFMTGRVLTALAVQHLIVILTAMMAGLVSYICFSLLAPGRRWIAWALALLYVSGPVTALYMYASEMYMTFTALAWLPLVLYGNVRLIRRNDDAGWLSVGVGLGLVWLCHAPVGLWASFVTAGVQGLRLLTLNFDAASWRKAAGGGLLFTGLLAYYFFSIYELPGGGNADSIKLLVYAVGLVLGLGSLVRLLVSGHGGWLASGALSLAALWWTNRAHAAWLALSLLVGAVLTWSQRRFPAFRWRDRLPECLGVVLLVSGLLAPRIMPETNSARNYMHAQAVKFVLEQFPQRFLPISDAATDLGDLQPGYAALGLLALSLGVALFRREWELRILALAGALFVCMLAPVPAVTAFLYSLVPDPVYGLCSIGLWLRFLPVLASIAPFAGGLALIALTSGRWPRLMQGAAFLGLLIALIWNYGEIQKPIERGRRAINTIAGTTEFYFTDGAALYYAYDRIPRPHYITYGIVDYHLESHLLNIEDHSLIADPLLGGPGEKVVTFTTHPNPFNASWQQLEPHLELQPGERLLLRFEFFDRPYTGVLTMTGQEFQRAYYLPEGGDYEKSFGVDASRPKVISIWNTHPKPQDLQLVFRDNAPQAGNKPFGDFARVLLQRYKPDDLQIKTRSLIPYRAEVALASASYLETPRVFIPGYRATINGQAVPVSESPDHLVMVRLEPGRNVVEVVYRGTVMSRILFALSALVWLAVLGYGAWRLRDWLSARPVEMHGRAGT